MNASTIRIPVPSTDAVYPVHVGRGILARIGALVREATPAHRYAVLADDKVASLYGDAVVARLGECGLRAELLTFPPGEVSKSRATWTDLTDRMLRAGFGRDAAVIAVGGGVTGDLAGFTASTYMRGLPLVTVPTSLLAMLDSSVGGKTAVDAAGAKNAVGTFHHPELVIVDPDVLQSLSATHLRAGLAEAVKAAAIRDAALFEWMERHASELSAGERARTTELIVRCVTIKADIVANDPHESGVRQILNFGHTAGHALESASGFALLHGAAVGAGMRLEARLGEAAGVTRPGTAKRLDALLRALGLPGVPGDPAAEALLELAATDKKSRGGVTRWVLLEEIGRVARDADGAWSHALDPNHVRTWLESALRATADVRDSAS